MNSSFSTKLPTLQLGIDSTSLGAFKTCPRYYQYTILEGWVPRHESVHLQFGLWLHGARERYDHQRLAGADHQQALDFVLDWILRQTWNKKLGRPWISDHPKKNRLTLLRTVIWYLDQFGSNDPFQTITLANGRPAVELSFQFDSGFTASTGESILFCGHLDRIGSLNGQQFIVDIKTTSYTISSDFFLKYTPSNQFSMYTLAAEVAFGQDINGIVVDAVQVATGFSRFQRGLVNRPSGYSDEWLAETGTWLRQMDESARNNHWPQNDTSCDRFSGCPFRSVCSKSPTGRQQWLSKEFTKRVWDPLVARGDF